MTTAGVPQHAVSLTAISFILLTSLQSCSSTSVELFNAQDEAETCYGVLLLYTGWTKILAYLDNIIMWHKVGEIKLTRSLWQITIANATIFLCSNDKYICSSVFNLYLVRSNIWIVLYRWFPANGYDRSTAGCVDNGEILWNTW